MVELEEQQLEMDKLKERIKAVVDREAAAAAEPVPAPPAGDVVAWPKQAKELVDERGSYVTFTKANPFPSWKGGHNVGA